MSFRRYMEDFTCSHCGLEVEGDGYTDHCPACLWGRHVDIDPGDRAARCDGMMRPVGVVEKKGGTRIAYVCEVCKHEFVVRSAQADSADAIIALAKASAKEKGLYYGA